MSTVMKTGYGATPSTPAKTPLNQDQLRRDRRTAIIVVGIMAVLMGLLIWLASVSGGGVSNGVDYWPLMP